LRAAGSKESGGVHPAHDIEAAHQARRNAVAPAGSPDLVERPRLAARARHDRSGGEARAEARSVVREIARGARWVRPVLVAEVAFVEWTGEHSAR
jgi:hypothetical protein